MCSSFEVAGDDRHEVRCECGFAVGIEGDGVLTLLPLFESSHSIGHHQHRAFDDLLACRHDGCCLLAAKHGFGDPWSVGEVRDPGLDDLNTRIIGSFLQLDEQVGVDSCSMKDRLKPVRYGRG